MKNHVFHDRSKHIQTRYHLIRQTIEDGDVHPVHVCGKGQLADILTKVFPKTRFKELQGKLGICHVGAQV
jgi:hypothetical protein